MKLISNLPETPYFQPPPIHIWDLKMRDRVRVITWDLQDGVAKPLITKKKNKVAAITDGEMVIKIAIFEEFSSKVLEGVSYMMRGHELRGTNPHLPDKYNCQDSVFQGSCPSSPWRAYGKSRGPSAFPCPCNATENELNCGGAYVSGRGGHGGKCLRLVKKETTDLYNYYHWHCILIEFSVFGSEEGCLTETTESGESHLAYLRFVVDEQIVLACRLGFGVSGFSY